MVQSFINSAKSEKVNNIIAVYYTLFVSRRLYEGYMFLLEHIKDSFM